MNELTKFRLKRKLRIIKRTLIDVYQVNLLGKTKLYSIKTTFRGHRNVILSLDNYYISKDGKYLVSYNRDTYVTDFGTKPYKLSNKCIGTGDKPVNTFRDFRGNRITLNRKDILSAMSMFNYFAKTNKHVKYLRMNKLNINQGR